MSKNADEYLRYAIRDADEMRIREYTASLAAGEYIYPADIAGRMSLPVADVYRYMETIQEGGTVASLLEEQCPACGRFTGERYGAFWNIPKTVRCPFCGKEDRDADINTVVIYRKL